MTRVYLQILITMVNLIMMKILTLIMKIMRMISQMRQVQNILKQTITMKLLVATQKQILRKKLTKTPPNQILLQMNNLINQMKIKMIVIVKIQKRKKNRKNRNNPEKYLV